MTWCKLDTMLPHHPALIDLAPETCWVYVAAICFGAQHLTDGQIERRRLKQLCFNVDDLEEHAERLVDVGLFDRTETGWQIVNFLGHQRSKAQVEKQRADARARAEASREVRAHQQRTNAVTAQKVREQSREEKNTHAHTQPVDNSVDNPVVIHKCRDCQQADTDCTCPSSSTPPWQHLRTRNQ